MNHKICLHGLNIKKESQLLGLIGNKAPIKETKNKIKEKSLPGNDLLRYKSIKAISEKGCTVTCIYGIMGKEYSCGGRASGRENEAFSALAFFPME